jgi:uncharacterized protein YbaP (TraB family)
MLYELSGTNLRLFGSIHRFPANKPTIPNWVWQAYEWADCLFTETDDAGILNRFKLPPGEDLQSLLPSDVWHQLQTLWPVSGPLTPLSTFKPWGAFLLGPMLCTTTVDGVEDHLRRHAKANSKATGFLERSEEFSNLADAIPRSELLLAMRQFLSDVSAPARQLNDMHAAWERGDVAAIYEIASKSSMFDFPSLREAFLLKRNQNWVKVIQPLLGSQQKTLVVVGALHLHGPGNVLELLRHPVTKLPTGNSPIST